MTLPGRQRKLCLIGLAAGLMAAGLGLVAPALPTRAGTSEWVVADRYSGLAISGYDPVAYFVEGRAVAGRGDLEHALAGAVWRFRNAGNRAAFIANPDVYMPRFGGYDPVGVARGVTVPGDPRLWHLADERLYLFYSLDHQAAFILDSDRTIATAERKWPPLRQALVR